MHRSIPALLLAATVLLGQTVAATVLLGQAVQAQVAVDEGALDALKRTPAAAAAKPAVIQQTRRRGSRPKPHAKAAAAKPASAPKAAAKAAPRPGPVTIPAAPPPTAMLAPTPAPVPRPVPEVPINVSADAAGAASRILGGVRVTFGSGASELNPTTEAALRSAARTIGADPAATFNVFAYAAGAADDPSTPRRLSLTRALAARAVLMSEGIASTRIYVRALGATPSDGPTDRVDVTQVGMTPAPS